MPCCSRRIPTFSMTRQEATLSAKQPGGDAVQPEVAEGQVERGPHHLGGVAAAVVGRVEEVAEPALAPAGRRVRPLAHPVADLERERADDRAAGDGHDVVVERVVGRRIATSPGTPRARPRCAAATG